MTIRPQRFHPRRRRAASTTRNTSTPHSLNYPLNTHFAATRRPDACIVLYMFNTRLDRAGADLRAARNSVDVAMWHASMAATKAHEKGTPETVIADKLGVNRMTVRKWLGK